MLDGNSQLLVRTLESLPLLEGRYSRLKLVNFNGVEKRGNFSLVFRGFDEIEERHVALKFFDLDHLKQDPYRISAFEREQEILKTLLGAPRCLQLVSPLAVYKLEIQIPSQPTPVSLPARYFVTEWIDQDIDQFFIDQQSHAAVEKLKIFNEVVLAVEGLHSRKVFHRDLKADNFRRRMQAEKEVVAIDLGTAARYDSPPILAGYGCFVGHRMYAAPEAFCGLAGDRLIAPYTDVYALGCLLFEMFHPDDFYTAYRRANPDFDIRLSALNAKVGVASNDADRLALWNSEADKLFLGLGKLSLMGSASTAPPAVASILSDVVAQMTAPNFKNRWSAFSRVRDRCWTAIRILENAAAAKRRAQQAAAQRAAKAAKAIRKAEKLQARQRLIAAGGR